MGYKLNLNTDGIEDAMKRALFRSVVKVQEIAKQKVPVNTGNLRNNIDVTPTNLTTKYKIVANTDYAAGIEFGTRPHDVSVAELKDWARKKLGDEDLAYPIAKKIRRFGTTRQPFMIPALIEVRNIHMPRIVSEEMVRLK